MMVDELTESVDGTGILAVFGAVPGAVPGSSCKVVVGVGGGGEMKRNHIFSLFVQLKSLTCVLC